MHMGYYKPKSKLQHFQIFAWNAKFLESLAAKRSNLLEFCVVESMLFQLSQCAFSNFLESYVSEFWTFTKVSFGNLP